MRHYASELVIGLVLVILTSLAYGQVGGNDFVNYDDGLFVIDNHHVYTGLSGRNLRWAWTIHTGFWMPLTWMSLQLDAQLAGLHPAGFHLTNVLLHIGNVLVLFGVLRMMTGSAWRSAAVAALFALHPIQVESVAWVSERKGLLCTFFWLLALWAYAWYVRRPRWTRYLLVVICFILGLMAKPMVVTLPCVLLLLDYWPLRRPAGDRGPGQPAGRYRFLTLVVEKLPLFALALGFSLVAVFAESQAGALTGLDSLPFDARLRNALWSYACYLQNAVWPEDLAVHYPHPLRSLSSAQVAAAFALLLGVTLSVLTVRRQAPYLTVGWFWFLGTLVPVIGLIQVGAHAMADRYAYVPVIGLFLMAAWGLADLAERYRVPAWVVASAAAPPLCLCLALTVAQVHWWQNSFTLWYHALRVTRNNHVAHDGLGSALWRAERYEEAAQQYLAALALKPKYARSHHHLGLTRFSQGRYEEADQHYAAALRLDPRHVDAHNNRGVALIALGRIEAGIKHYEAAIRLDPECLNAQNNLGSALLSLGRVAEAVATYRAAVQVLPDVAGLRYHLADALRKLGHHDEADAQDREGQRLERSRRRVVRERGRDLAQHRASS